MLAIVITYYKPYFFEATLQSLASQSDNRFKVYVGSDAAPTNPKNILKSYANQLDIISHTFVDNLGKKSLTKQWDRCIALTQDEPWLMVLCDDDLLSENVVASFYENLKEIENNGVQVVKYASQVIDAKGGFISERFTQPKLQEYGDVFYKRFFEKYRSSLSEHIFSRKAYVKHGFRDIPLAWHADDWAWLDFSEFGKIYTINEASVYFRHSEVNISRMTYLSEEKKLLQYQFYKSIVYDYLEKFKRRHRFAILKRFEHLTYSLKKNDFSFWKGTIPLKYKYEGLREALKFTRRMYVNRNKTG
jgi:glycosyltransferase involved in cell wall biosynthesis